MEQTENTKPSDDLLRQVQELKREQSVKNSSLSVARLNALKALENALSELKANKPNDRSEQDRYWAIVITDIEKARAVFKTYVE